MVILLLKLGKLSIEKKILSVLDRVIQNGGKVFDRKCSSSMNAKTLRNYRWKMVQNTIYATLATFMFDGRAFQSRQNVPYLSKIVKVFAFRKSSPLHHAPKRPNGKAIRATSQENMFSAFAKR